MSSLFTRQWRQFWLRFARHHGAGRIAASLAAWGTPAGHGRSFLAGLHPRGFVAPSASLSHPNLEFGRNVYIGDRVNAFADPGGGPIAFGDKVHIYGDTYLRTAAKGNICFGSGTHVQPFCFFVACISPIMIGASVEIAPACAFYSFNHGMAPDRLIMRQPCESKGPIIIGDGAWLGHGVTVLQNVTIGEGAVIGAGSVVTQSVPAGAIAAGSPSRILGSRDDHTLVAATMARSRAPLPARP